MTKSKFLENYKSELIKRYPWASDSNKLDKFISSVELTLNGASSWDCNGEAVESAWKSLNVGKGKVSLKKLRELPN